MTSSGSGNTSAPLVSKQPQEYVDGCVQPVLVPGAKSKNQYELALKFGMCDRLQAENSQWTGRYLFALGRKK